jgi:hypothetical protein
MALQFLPDLSLNQHSLVDGGRLVRVFILSYRKRRDTSLGVSQSFVHTIFSKILENQ